MSRKGSGSASSSVRSHSQADEQSGEQVSYEQARDELAQVVATLEQGGLDLESSLTLWERGEKLARRCSLLLDGAEARVRAVLDAESEQRDDEPDGLPDGELVDDDVEDDLTYDAP